MKKHSMWTNPGVPTPRKSLILLAGLGVLLSGTLRDTAQAQPKEDSTVVVLLGTGMPRPNPAASGPATAVVVDSNVFLVDAGPGVERQLSAAGLPINGVTAVFITHLHTDHTLGYPDLIFTSWVMGRKGPLIVYGPPGLRRMTEHLMAAYSEDIAVRIHGLEHEPGEGYKVTVHEIAPGVVYDSLGVKVTAISVQHGNWESAFAYRFDTPDRSVVISGDTRFSENLIAHSKGVDVLVHEVYSAAHLKPESRPGGEDWPRYMHEFHTSDFELGKLAARVQPKLLILTHLIRMGASDDELIAGVRAGGYQGAVVVGHDLDRH